MSSIAAQFIAASAQRLEGPTTGFGNSDWTITGWYWNDSLAGGAIVAKDGAGGTNRCFGVFQDDGGGHAKLSFDTHRSDAQTTSLLSVGTVANSTWNFFAVWYDSATNTMGLSLNNATAVTGSTGGALQGGSAPFCIGGRSFSGSLAPMDGRVQNVTVHTRVLMGYERSLLYNRGFGRFYPSLIDGLLTNLYAQYALSEASGSRADSTGNGHTLTVVNVPGSAAGMMTGMPSGDASYGGLGSKNFVDTTEVAGGAGGRTFISGPQSAILQNGTITSIKYRSKTTFGTNNIKIKVFRVNGSNYDFVGESEKWTAVIGSTQTRTLATPITGVRPGDLIGVWLDVDGGGSNFTDIWVTTLTNSTIHWIAGDNTGTNINFPGANDIANSALDLEAFGVAPVAGMTGDSIECGHGTNYLSFMDGTGPVGDITGELGYQMRQSIGGTFTYQDYSKGSQTWSWVRTAGVPAMQTGAGAHQSAELMNSEYWFHCGVNDVAAARLWASVLADLNEIYGLCGSAPMFIDEILPWTNGDDTQAATIRTFNANLNAWKVGKSTVTIIATWAAMGQLRVSTGFNDDLLHSVDGVHEDAVGAAVIAALRATARATYYNPSNPRLFLRDYSMSGGLTAMAS